MPIKIVPQGNLYAAEVTPPHGDWRSPHTMRSDELGRKLLSIGCDPEEIRHALLEAGVQPFSAYYREAAEEARPHLQSALEGNFEILPQPLSTEAWLAFVLFCHERVLPLDEVIGSADALNVDVPTPDEISWAFVRLRRRGWLLVRGDSYGLTPEGRRAIDGVVGGGRVWEQVMRLEEWTLVNPPPSGSEGVRLPPYAPPVPPEAPLSDRKSLEVWRARRRYCFGLAYRVAPEVLTALAGGREVPPQPPYLEARLAWFLCWRFMPATLDELIDVLESVRYLEPTSDEVSWPLLQLRQRGWVSQHGNTFFSMTLEAQRFVELVAGKGDVGERLRRLEAWIGTHPPPTKGNRL